MSNVLDAYKGYVLIGAGVVADRMTPQLLESGLELLGVADNLDETTRKKTSYRDVEVKNLSEYKDILERDDVCAILAINAFQSLGIIDYYGNVCGFDYNKLILPNPYTCLRPCVMNDDFASETRIPVTDSIYDEVRGLFKDDESLKVFDKLRYSKTYDSEKDSYELVKYTDIKDMYYFYETYWHGCDFTESPYEYATIFDCGAYIGDSLIQICSDIPEDKIIYYAFEPDEENASIIRNNQEFTRFCEKIEVVEYGVGNENATLGFELPDNKQKDAGRFVKVSDDYDGEKLEIRRMDDLGLDIKGRLYIKMDIEGSELDALKGAESIIKEHSPYLAICVYHKKNDMVEIPKYISGLGCEYDYYLRGGFHTILWAVPRR